VSHDDFAGLPERLQPSHAKVRLKYAGTIKEQAEQIAALIRAEAQIIGALAKMEAERNELEAQNRALREALTKMAKLACPIIWTSRESKCDCKAHKLLRAALATPGIAPATPTEQP
jgi:hypothetical protein